MHSNPDPPGWIMVVDDDATLIDVIARYLCREGHHVECVQDGDLALRRVAEDPPDLMVMDLSCPARAAWRSAGGCGSAGRSRW